jgi:hypothetical protein
MSMPNFLQAAMMASFTSERVTPFMGYCAAFFGTLMYDQAERACASVSTGYLPFFGSAYFTSPYGFAFVSVAMSALPACSIAACCAGYMPVAAWWARLQ